MGQLSRHAGLDPGKGDFMRFGFLINLRSCSLFVLATMLISNLPEPGLVQAADATSAARPGARREVLESYVKRLEQLEEMASSFSGVSKAFALQAGREVRIMVESSKVSDEEAFWLSKKITKKIESELQYPGQIKVTLIREMRVVDYAK